MVYLDNAATGGFKPHSVTDTVNTVVKFLCANPGRSGHRLSLAGAELVYNTRNILANQFGATGERVIFTKNCTEALNLAIFGTLKKGGHVITTVYEHNSVLRPLHALLNEGLITLDIVAPTETKNIAECIEEKINNKTYMIITTAISNVTGEVLPVEVIGKIAKNHNLIYIVDGAQGGGHINLNLRDQNITLLALAGHKGLYGIMGSGVLIFNDEIEVDPLLYGGTGTDSFNVLQPSSYPEKLEAGTLNLPSIAALKEGVTYVNKNFYTFSSYLTNSTARLLKYLNKIKNIKCYSLPNPAGIVAFKVLNTDSAEVADILNTNYDIAVRGGLHCAPLMHKFMGTEDGGLVRASLAVQNNATDLSYLIKALIEITKN